MDPKIIRVDDYVKIINPRFIYRWGYENNLQDKSEMVKKKYDDLIERFVASILVREGLTKDAYASVTQATRWKVANGVAYELVAWNMKNGSERKLFYCTDPSFKETWEYQFELPWFMEAGQIYQVDSIKYVKTGTFVKGGGSSYDPYSGEYDYDPSYLENEKTHKLLRLECSDHWIEACDVEKVDPPSLQVEVA
jgi:hypothetical protein